MPRSSLCTYEFVGRIVTSTLQEHTLKKGNNGLNTSTNQPKIQKKTKNSDSITKSATLCFKNCGGTSHSPWHSEGIWSFPLLSLQASVAAAEVGRLPFPGGWPWNFWPSTVSPHIKNMKTCGFCWHGPRRFGFKRNSNLEKCFFYFTAIHYWYRIVDLLRPGKTVKVWQR